MQTIRDVAKHLGLSAGELLGKAQALGLPVKDVNSEVSPEAQRDLKRVRSLSLDQIKTFIRRAPPKKEKVIITVPEPWITHPETPEHLQREPLDQIDFLQKEVHQLRAELSSVRGRMKSLEETTLDSLASLEGKPNQSLLAEQELRASLSALRKRLDLVEREMRQAVSAEDRNTIFTSIGDVQRNLDIVRREMSVNASTTNKAREAINGLQQQLKDLRSLVETSEADQKQADVEAKRIENAISKSQSMSEFTYAPATGRLKKTLEAAGYYFHDAVFDECFQVLARGRPLLLVGPSGTGKSTLARHLPLVFWEESANATHITTVEANEQWTPFDLLGGRWPVGDRIVPKLGVFSESIVRCVEQAGRHWLFIDELNRADVDKAFAGLLGTLGSLHEGATVNIPATTEPIYIPKSFRLICAMNDSDERHLFPISTSILSRFEIVRIDPPKTDLEKLVIFKHCAEELKRATNAVGNQRQDKERLTAGIDAFLSTLAEFRRVGIHTGAKELVLGLRDSISIAQRACARIEQQDEDVMQAFGETILSVLASRLEALPNETVRVLLESETIQSAFPKIHETLQQEFGKRVYVAGL